MTVNGKHMTPDFQVVGQRKVIEVFGDYWHKDDDPQDRIDQLAQAGFECLVLWESEIHQDPEGIKAQVLNFQEVTS